MEERLLKVLNDSPTNLCVDHRICQDKVFCPKFDKKNEGKKCFVWDLEDCYAVKEILEEKEIELEEDFNERIDDEVMDYKDEISELEDRIEGFEDDIDSQETVIKNYKDMIKEIKSLLKSNLSGNEIIEKISKCIEE